MMHGSVEPSQLGGRIRSRRTHDALEPSPWVQSQGTRGDVGAHLDWKAGPRAAGHVATPKPTSTWRQDPVLLDMWQHVGAHLGWKAGPRATGHVVALVLLDMWRRMGAHPIPCLDLKLVRMGTWSARYRHYLCAFPVFGIKYSSAI
jgi:hypothetical protein